MRNNEGQGPPVPVLREDSLFPGDAYQRYTSLFDDRCVQPATSTSLRPSRPARPRLRRAEPSLKVLPVWPDPGMVFRVGCGPVGK